LFQSVDSDNQHVVIDGSGSILFHIINSSDMKHNYIDFDQSGNPVSFFDDENEIYWVYQGKSENGADNWYGCIEYFANFSGKFKL
jgi:hypothetical protein